MNPLFSKSSVEVVLSEKDIDIFKQVVEKRFNEHTKLNKWFENEFKLSDSEYQQYQPYVFDSINLLEPKMFVKAVLADRFVISLKILKNKAFIKCFKDDELVLEISCSKKQIEAIEDKYDINLDNINKEYYLIYASTFMRNDHYILTSKLIDLRLIKIAYK
ncbi:MAG: hypothetical protein ACRC5R_00405 [Mycoplasmatales bacterium]